MTYRNQKSFEEVGASDATIKCPTASTTSGLLGAVDGEAIVHLNRCGRGFQYSLAKFHLKYHGGRTPGRTWDPTFPTSIRALKDDILLLNRVTSVIDVGLQETLVVSLASRKTVRLSGGCNVFTGYGQLQRASSLRAGDTVLSNGKWTDKDGYVRVGGYKHKHHRHTTGGVYEHILVAEAMIGRKLSPQEHVHHRNGIRHDNSPDNLQVLNADEHLRLHGRKNFLNLHNGKKVQYVPHFDTVTQISAGGLVHCYTVVCEQPHGNFVADGVLVQGPTVLTVNLNRVAA